MCKNKLNIIKYTLLVLLLAIQTPSFSNSTNPRFKAVQDYLLNGEDYLELFKDEPYRIQVNGVAIGDLNSDAEDEVVLMIKPHYLQSPTIIIFQVDDEMNVSRVVEGLAPGPLQPISGEYLDSHTLGQAVDFNFEKEGRKVERNEKLVDDIINQFGGVVEYENWFHTDGRSGTKMYIDMRHVKVPENMNHCEYFDMDFVCSNVHK